MSMSQNRQASNPEALVAGGWTLCEHKENARRVCVVLVTTLREVGVLAEADATSICCPGVSRSTEVWEAHPTSVRVSYLTRVCNLEVSAISCVCALFLMEYRDLLLPPCCDSIRQLDLKLPCNRTLN